MEIDQMVRIDVLFGSVEPQSRYEIEGLRIVTYHRAIHRDRTGEVVKETPWESYGSIGFDEPTGLFAWFERRRLQKELATLFAACYGR